jgi:hypothetical protein
MISQANLENIRGFASFQKQIDETKCLECRPPIGMPNTLHLISDHKY